jgi:hypothetical protein
MFPGSCSGELGSRDHNGPVYPMVVSVNDIVESVYIPVEESLIGQQYIPTTA